MEANGLDMRLMVHVGAEFVVATGLFMWTSKQVSAITERIDATDKALAERLNRIEEHIKMQGAVIMEMEKILTRDPMVLESTSQGDRPRILENKRKREFQNLRAGPRRREPELIDTDRPPSTIDTSRPYEVEGSREVHERGPAPNSRPGAPRISPVRYQGTPPGRNGMSPVKSKRPPMAPVKGPSVVPEDFSSPIEEEEGEPDVDVLDRLLRNELSELAGSRKKTVKSRIAKKVKRSVAHRRPPPSDFIEVGPVEEDYPPPGEGTGLGASGIESIGVVRSRAKTKKNKR
jgi:hypothetical protein